MRCDLVQFVQLKKYGNTHGGVLVLDKLQTLACNYTKSSIPPWCFFCLINCANGTKFCKASHIIKSFYQDTVAHMKINSLQSISECQPRTLSKYGKIWNKGKFNDFKVDLERKPIFKMKLKSNSGKSIKTFKMSRKSIKIGDLLSKQSLDSYLIHNKRWSWHYTIFSNRWIKKLVVKSYDTGIPKSSW